jgi:hypothetical protein
VDDRAGDHAGGRHGHDGRRRDLDDRAVAGTRPTFLKIIRNRWGQSAARGGNVYTSVERVCAFAAGRYADWWTTGPDPDAPAWFAAAVGPFRPKR